MRKKNILKVAAGIITAFTVIGTLKNTTVLAAASDRSNTVVPATANKVTIEQFLIMPKNAYVPAEEFQYTIAGGTAGVINGKTVYSGTDTTNTNGQASKVVGTPTIGHAVFTPNQMTYDGTEADTSNLGTASNNNTAEGSSTLGIDPAGYVLPDGVTLADGMKYAKSDITIDFSGVSFKEPGIYRYVIQQNGTYLNGSADPYQSSYYTFDANAYRYLDVYVGSNDGDDSLRVNQYILRNSVNDDDTAKTKGYVNTYKTRDLTVKKTISGNQARADVAFEFTIQINNLPGNYKMNIATTSSAGEMANTLNKGGTVVTALTDARNYGSGQTTFKVWLKAGETVTIDGLPNGSEYYVVENADQLKQTGYTSSVGTAFISKYSLSSNNANWLFYGFANYDDMLIEVNNDKAGVIPTGVIIAVAPYATVSLLGFAGLLIFAKRKKSKEDEDN